MLATELDALDSSELARLIEEAIKPYRDPPGLEDQWIEAGDTANRIAVEADEWVAADYQEEVDAIQSEVHEILDQYRDRVAALNEELQRDLKTCQQRMEAARHAMQTAIDEIDDVFTLPSIPEPDDPDGCSEWLFDSSRSYLLMLRGL